jgi:hypothetical protein
LISSARYKEEEDVEDEEGTPLMDAVVDLGTTNAVLVDDDRTKR